MNYSEPIDPYTGMTKGEKRIAVILHVLMYISAIIFCIFVCSLFSGCKSVEYVQVPEVHEQHHWHTDSVIQHDSTYHETTTTIMQLDSAEMARYGIQLKSAERAWLVKTAELERQIQQLKQLSAQKDSVCDSIPSPIEVTKEVPAELTWWQHARLHLANIVLWMLLILGVGWIIKKKLL